MLHSVSNISYASNSITNALSIQDWLYEDSGSTQHILEVTNNSPYTLNIRVNETAKDSAGNAIGESSTSEDDILVGTTVFLINYFSECRGAQFWYSYRNPEVKYYIPVIQDITVEATDLKDKVLVKVINNGNIPAEFVRGTEVFFGGNKVLGYNTQYFCDSELKPRASMTN